MMNLKHITTKPQLRRFYLSLLPEIRRIAREHGYAIAIHGSMERDFDLMAMPWVKNAKSPTTLLRAIEMSLLGYQHKREHWRANARSADKPHGRFAISMHLGWLGKPFIKRGKGMAYLDISIMPRYE